MLRSLVARRRSAVIAFLGCTLAIVSAAAAAAPSALVVVPSEVKLEGNFARLQLLALRPNSSGEVNEHSDDATTQATYESSDPAVVTVSSAGQLRAVGNG